MLLFHEEEEEIESTKVTEFRVWLRCRTAAMWIGIPRAGGDFFARYGSIEGSFRETRIHRNKITFSHTLSPRTQYESHRQMEQKTTRFCCGSLLMSNVIEEYELVRDLSLYCTINHPASEREIIANFISFRFEMISGTRRPRQIPPLLNVRIEDR